MTENRPAPWMDHVNKLLALSGLAAFVIACALIVKVVESGNDKVLDMVEESEVLKHAPRPSDVHELRRAVLEQKIDLAVSNRQTYTALLIVVAATSANVAWFGFKRWLGRVQPLTDEMARVQLQIARLQLRKLQRECDAGENRGNPP